MENEIAGMPRRNESFGEMLIKLPWWVSTTLAVIAFAAIRWGMPMWAGDENSRQILAKAVVPLAPLALILFGGLAVCSFWLSKRNGRLVDDQTSLESLRATSWKDFEYLVAEAFRRQGYQIDYSLRGGADGGFDLILKRDGRKALVQCKQWKTWSVGAPVIREMFGLMTAEKADEAIIVTTGGFTRDAKDFASGKPIRLIDGPQLLVLVQSVQSEKQSRRPEVAPTVEPVPPCPLCGKRMVLRTARRGNNAGNQFWGCSSYPACKGIRELTVAVK